MKTHHLGSLKVGRIGLGTMGMSQMYSPSEQDEGESTRTIHRALDLGVTLVDTAEIYGPYANEELVGRALKDRRDEVVLATKVNGEMGPGPNDRGISRYHIMKACDDSLRRLQTDHIDLYQLHRPALNIPQDETLRALDDLVRAGKVRYIGCSTFPAWMVMEALGVSERYGLARFISEQPPYNLLDRRIENELVPLAQRYGLALLPWSPLAGGILAGRYNDPARVPAGSRLDRNGRESPFGERVTRRGVAVARGVAEIARERGLTASQLALLWCKDQPGVTAPIIGPRTMDQLRDALGVLELEISDDGARLDALNPPGNAVSDFHNSNEWMKTRVRDEAQA